MYLIVKTISYKNPIQIVFVRVSVFEMEAKLEVIRIRLSTDPALLIHKRIIAFKNRRLTYLTFN